MRQLVISEQDHVAALMENGRATEFIISKNEYSVGNVYAVTVENIMQSINAVFVKLQDGQMGFLHANDVPGRGLLNDRLSPGQRLLVQIVKEPTGNKGPRVNLGISIPGRYYVLTTENKAIAISRRISENAERDRLRSITNLMKPEELGVVIRTEAAGRSQEELEEDFLNIWERWKNIIDKYERSDSYGPIYRESDFLYTTLRDYYNNTIDEVVVGNMSSKYKCQEHLKTWTGREVSVTAHENDQVLYKTDVVKEIRNCLSNRVNLPSGGYIIIQGMEALTAIDINSGKFTSSNTLRETVRRTNMEAAMEIARQMRLRNIGGMIIIDFIDMADRADRIGVMEVLEAAVRPDKAKPQVGQLSDLCLVEITRKRSGQALAEIFGSQCQHCTGTGVIFNLKGGMATEDAYSQNRRSRPQHQHQHQQQRGNFRDRDNRDRDSRDNRGERGERSGNRDRDSRDNRGERGERSEYRNNRNDRNDRNDRPGGGRNTRNNRFNNRNREPKVYVPGGGANNESAPTETDDNAEALERNFETSSGESEANFEPNELTKSKTFSKTHMIEEESPNPSFSDTEDAEIA